MNQHPGCFGSPLCHRHAALPCTRCPFIEPCGTEAMRVATALREEYEINHVIEGRIRSGQAPSTKGASLGPAQRRRKAKPRPRDMRTEQGVRDHIADHGIDLAQALKDRTNPFKTHGPLWLSLAFDEAMAGRAGVESLTRAIQARLHGQTPEQAAVLARIAMALFAHPTLP